MKVIDIAIKDMVSSMRSMSAWLFMFIVPILITVLFYFAFGSFAQRGEFSLPRVSVVIANQDEGGPNLHLRGKNVPGELEAHTLGELVVKVLQSDELAELIDVSILQDEIAARTAVDNQEAQVAVIIPIDFSKKFADPIDRALIILYQDPTLTIGPAVVESILNQFMDGLAGINIAADIALDQSQSIGDEIVGQVIQQYLASYMMQDDDLSASILNIQEPDRDSKTKNNALLAIVGPIMGGMMIFYSFYTGTASAHSILKEEEERTLSRLFATPSSHAVILGGKYLAVFMTVLVQIVTLLGLSRLIFLIQWGNLMNIAMVVVGLVYCASSFGIFLNSLFKTTKQGSVVFGGVMTLTGMIGMIKIFSMGVSAGSHLNETIPLLVPQGWAVQGILQSMDGMPLSVVIVSALGMIVWGIIFFLIGVWRFTRRYR